MHKHLLVTSLFLLCSHLYPFYQYLPHCIELNLVKHHRVEKLLNNLLFHFQHHQQPTFVMRSPKETTLHLAKAFRISKAGRNYTAGNIYFRKHHIFIIRLEVKQQFSIAKDNIVQKMSLIVVKTRKTHTFFWGLTDKVLMVSGKGSSRDAR